MNPDSFLNHPLESERLKLRALEPEDVDLLYAWENDPAIWQISNTIAPFSRFVLRQFLENAHRDIFEVKQMRLMIEVKKEPLKKPVGTVEMFDFDPLHRRAGIGILIAAPEDRRQGFASEALRLMLDYAFQHLGLHQLFCNIECSNEASIKLFTKAGFQIIGIKKQWLRTSRGWADEVLMQCLNPEHSV